MIVSKEKKGESNDKTKIHWKNKDVRILVASCREGEKGGKRPAAQKAGLCHSKEALFSKTTY